MKQTLPPVVLNVLLCGLDGENMTDEALKEDLREAFNSGCPFLVIYSRRQDVGIQKCERGVELGLLRFQEYDVSDQETHWRYYWTDNAKKLWQKSV